MSTEQKTIINKIKKADIVENDSWLDEIINHVEDKYARGYLRAKATIYCDAFSTGDEELRECMLEVCEYDIWGK